MHLAISLGSRQLERLVTLLDQELMSPIFIQLKIEYRLIRWVLLRDRGSSIASLFKICQGQGTIVQVRESLGKEPKHSALRGDIRTQID